MQQRHLGAGRDLTVSALGLGCMGMSHAYGGQDVEASVRTLHRAVDLGVTFFDTAEVYGPYDNEYLLGAALAGREVKIATKFGFKIAAGGGDGVSRMIGHDGRPKNAKRVAEASLKRLKREVIDLYYLHRTDPDVPIEETVGAMAELVAEGKVRSIGLSEPTLDELRRGHAVHPIAAVQSEYSLWVRGVERDILPYCRANTIGFVPFAPLGRGQLTGALRRLDQLGADDFRRGLPRFNQQNFEQNAELLSDFFDLAAQFQVTPAQLSLAWLLHQGEFIVPIPGARKIPHLEDNSAAADLRLTAEQLARIAAAANGDAVQGERYARQMVAAVR